MRLKKWISLALCVAMTAVWLPDAGVSEVQAQEARTDREVLNFNTDWLYSKGNYRNGESVNLNDSGFEKVSVPHANTFIDRHVADDFEKDISDYRFVSWYRRHFKLPESYAGRNIMVEFEGVATVAEVYLNGELVGEHKGAYTGFTVDISDVVYTDGRDNVLAVRVDSQRQPQIPPEGGSVDYCLFGGIVRDVSMTITDPVYVERTFVTTPGLESGNGVVKTQVDIKNTLTEDKTYTVETTVKDKDGNTVKTASVEKQLAAGKETTVEVETEKITNPHLWDIDDPYLYTLVTTVKDGDTVIDTYDTTFGMRYFEFKSNSDTDRSFYLNGKKVVVVGVNRHEQWPWVGRAVPDKLQEQDADLIKETGFNAVRCSHYPQDPSFMKRCDEIGLLVFTEPPGWQHIGNAEWQENFKTNLKELILRDRNHPSVISWGVTPNESEAYTADIQAFNQECNRIAKELDPTRPTHGVRWEFFFDNHTENGKLQHIATDLLTANYRYPGFKNNKDEDLLSRFENAYLVTEHSNECWFNGGGVPGTTDELALQFVDSFMKYVDYFYEKDTIAGGFGWSMFDYNNEVNYTNTNHVFYSGVYDIFRHEKPLAWAYRTQQDVEDAGEMVYIANSETGNQSTTTNTVYVFSNCEEVELFAGGVSQGKIKPNKYMSLPHPIFEFTNVNYAGKELKAVAYIGGKAVKEDVQAVTGEAVKLVVEPDYDTLTADGTDMTSVSVTAVDANGNKVPFAKNKINVTQKSGTETTLISEKDVALEGGQSAFLVQSLRDKTGEAEFEVTSDGLTSGTCKIAIGEYKAENLVPVSEGTGTEEPELPSRLSINDSEVGDGLNRFDYQGAGWESGGETAAYGGDNHWSSTKDDFCEIRFEGAAGIQYYGAKAPAHGIIAFSVDGGEEILVDCYSASRQDSVILFDSGILGEGEHVLKARVTGDKNPAGGGTFVNADRAVIYPIQEALVTYFMENAANDGQRVAIDGSSKNAGAPVITWPGETDVQYRWALKPVERGYQLVNANSNLVMCATDGKITQEAPSGSENQLWILESVDGSEEQYRLQNVASKSYLTVTDNRAYGMGYEMSVAERAEDNKQIWKLQETDTLILQAEIEDGTIEPQAAIVTKGESKDFTATVAEGYELNAVIINGKVLEKEAYEVSAEGVVTFTLNNITKNQYITVDTKKEGTVETDKKALQKAVENAVPAEDEARYTEETWAEYAKALDDAKKVLADEKVEQAVVDAAAKALTDAQKALEEIVVYPPQKDAVTYFMENAAYAGQRAAIDGAGPKDPGTPVITWPDETDMQYRWALKAVDGGYQLINANSNLVMTAAEGKITQEAADGSENQLWVLEFANGTDNQYRLQNVASKTYLTVTNNRAYGSGYEMSVAERAADNKQIWKLEETDTLILQAAIDHGTIEPQAATVTKGESKDYTVTAAAGYEVASITVNGKALEKEAYQLSAGGVVTFTLTNITENQYITVATEEAEIVVADKTKLAAAIDAADKANYVEAEYTEDSWKEYADALSNAKAVNAREDATQLEVDKAEEALDKAVKALKKAVKVDKSKLDAAVKAEKPAEDVDKYTKETWDAYQKALEAAKKVLADEKADQAAVDAAVKELADAREALQEKPTGLPFDDVAEGEWYYDAISYNYYAGTMTGLTPTHFGPSDTLVRAQFASVLHKMNGEVKMDYTDTFADVTEPDWFKDAVLWAAANEIVTGYTGTDLFGANDVVTREQMATMMYRYAKNFKKYEVSADGDCSKFPDAETIQPFAQEAMKWAVKEEIITGKTIDGVLLLDPQGSANRAECAMIIQRFLEKYEK